MKAVFVLLLLVLPLNAQTFKIPATVKGDPGDFITITADTDCETVEWYSIDSGLKLFPSELLRTSKSAVVIAQKKGTYRLLGYTAKDNRPSKPQICKVEIGNPEPGPEPEPEPEPPVPPSDPLFTKLSEEYKKEADPNKAAQIILLADLYKVGGEEGANLDTYDQLFTVMSNTANRTGLSGKLPLVQRVLQADLTTALPGARVPGTKIAKAEMQPLFAKYSKLLRQVK